MENLLTLGSNPIPLTMRDLGEMAVCLEQSGRPNLVGLSMDIREYLDKLLDRFGVTT